VRLIRLAVLGATTLALVGLQDVPFAAADTTLTIRSYDDFPVLDRSVGITYQSCDAASAGEELTSTLPEPTIERGPGPVPLGTRTWGFDAPTPGALGPFHTITSMANIGADQMQVSSDSGTAHGAALAGVTVDDGNAWYGVAPLTVTAGSWQTVQGADSTSYTWREVNLNTGATEGSPFSGSIADLLTQVGGDRPGYVGLGFGCDGGMVHFDDVQMGVTGDVTTYDYEGGVSTTSTEAAHRTVTAGRSPRLSGRLVLNGVPTPAPRLVLERRAFGSTRWHRVTSAPTTPSQNPVSLVTGSYLAKPLRTTSYRWRYVGNEVYDGSVSKALSIRVRTAVRAHAPARAALGSRVRLTGSTLPKKPGQRITLWRGSHLLDATKVGRRGTFSLATTARFRGRLNLVVEIGASPGNLRGSKSLVVKVR
jgi:hypothetical protein